MTENRIEAKVKQRINSSKLLLSPPNLNPYLVWRDIWRARDWLTLLRGGQRIGLYLGVREQAHLQLHSHLPRSGHLSHELHNKGKIHCMLT